MKTLVLCLSILCLYSCKKEDMAATHPEYSFVRLNQDGFNLGDCSPDINKCLPINSLDDVRFQLITDFQETVPPSGINMIAAFPCQDNSETPANVFNDVFNLPYNVSSVGRDATGVISGFAGALTLVTSVANAATVDDYVYVTASSITGTDIRGLGKVIFKGASDQVFLNVSIPSTPSAWTNLRMWLIPDGYILANESNIIEANSEFSGNNYAWNFDKATSSGIIYEEGDCFSFCVHKLSFTQDGVYTSATYLGSTNCFTYTSNTCYTTKLEYGCNEDAFGFYGQGFFNSIRLPMYLSRPNYDSDEKGYQKSNGQFVKLAERVNKTFELRTDWMPSEWHDRLRVALSCDTIQVTNENENLTSVAIYKKDEYEVEWDSEIDFPLAKGKAKVFKGLFRKSVNSNCV